MTRDELAAWLRETHTQEEADAIMEHVDEYAATLTEEPPEAWTAQQVADHIKAPNPDTARAAMSKWGIASIAFVFDPESRRNIAVYPAQRVRDEFKIRGRRGTPCKTSMSS